MHYRSEAFAYASGPILLFKTRLAQMQKKTRKAMEPSLQKSSYYLSHWGNLGQQGTSASVWRPFI